MGSDRIELPADKRKIEGFVQNNTEGEPDYFVYVLECETSREKEARERAEDLFPPKTKEEVRQYQKEKNSEHWENFSEGKKQQVMQRESGFNPPMWYWEALDAANAYYVGYTPNVSVRINQHIEGTASVGARFTKVFPPTNLVEVHGFQDKDRALNAENEVALELTTHEEFAYSF